MTARGDSRPLWLDASHARPGGKGAAVYARSVLEAMHALAPERDVRVLVRDEWADAIAPLCPEWEVVPVRIRSAAAWAQLALPRATGTPASRALHVLGEGPVGRHASPYTMAVHELPHLRLERVPRPDGRPQRPSLAQRLVMTAIRAACRRAAGIVALSHSTARDLVRVYGLSADRVRVAYPGVDASFFGRSGTWARRSPLLGEGSWPYALVFASGDAREDVGSAVGAFARAVGDAPHHLVVAGHTPEALRDLIRARLTRAGLGERVHFVGFVPQDELPTLYGGADVFVELSRYEGFGLQVAEAMAAGATVVACAASSVPEVVGEAGILVRPGSEDDVVTGLRTALGDGRLRERLRREGPRQAAAFTWEACARTTWALIDELGGARGAAPRSAAPGSAATVPASAGGA